MRLRQVLFAVQPGASQQALQQAAVAANDARTRIASCTDADSVAQSVGSPGSGDLGSVRLSDLPAGLRQAVANLPIGQPSNPMQVSGGVAILVVCEREDGDIDRQRIFDSLLDQRLNLLERRYMRDLRRQANVDIRL